MLFWVNVVPKMLILARVENKQRVIYYLMMFTGPLIIEFILGMSKKLILNAYTK